MAFSTASLGSPRVVGIFSVRIGSPARRQTMSVKVPPMSTPISTAGAGLGMRGAIRLREWFDAWIARQGCGRAGCQPLAAMTETPSVQTDNEAIPCPTRGSSPRIAAIHVAHAPSSRRTLVLAACMMATFMAAVESSIVATAMPTIVADLGGFNLFSWVFAVYLLTQAVSIPIYGRLSPTSMAARRCSLSEPVCS